MPSFREPEGAVSISSCCTYLYVLIKSIVCDLSEFRNWFRQNCCCYAWFSYFTKNQVSCTTCCCCKYKILLLIYRHHDCMRFMSRDRKSFSLRCIQYTQCWCKPYNNYYIAKQKWDTTAISAQRHCYLLNTKSLMMVLCMLELCELLIIRILDVLDGLLFSDIATWVYNFLYMAF